MSDPNLDALAESWRGLTWKRTRDGFLGHGATGVSVCVTWAQRQWMAELAHSTPGGLSRVCWTVSTASAVDATDELRRVYEAHVWDVLDAMGICEAPSERVNREMPTVGVRLLEDCREADKETGE